MEPPAVADRVRLGEKERGENTKKERARLLLFIHTKLPAPKRRNASWTAKST